MHVGSVIPTAGDAEESKKIIQYLSMHYSSPVQDKIGYSIYGKPWVNKTEIILYRIVNRTEQDKVIKILTLGQKLNHWKTIDISFYKKEILNVKNKTERGYVTERGYEKLLRSYRID
jgi:hypothetical protein